MKEARIICLAPSIRIPDLDLVMSKDQEAYIGEKAARDSVDLYVATRAGGVQLHWVERSQVVRSPVVSAAPQADISKRGFKATTPVVEKLEVDLDVLAKKVADQMIAQQRDPETNRKIDVLMDLIGNLRRDLASGPVVQSGSSGGRVLEDSGPVFIPQNLVNADLGTVEVKTDDSGSGDGLDKAAEALKALRKRKERP